VARIVVTEPIHEDGIAVLRAYCGDDVQVFESGATDAEIAEALPSAEAILVRTRPLSADILDNAPRLKIVSKHGVGCDNIAIDHMNQRGLPVAIAADANAISVAEHTMALKLACAKNLIEQDRETRNADWQYRHRVEAFELSEKTVLVIGLGRIGGRVARLCQAFGMRVLGYDPDAGTAPFESVADLESGLKMADIVTLHIPFSATSKLMLSAERIAAMKPGAMLINCARGGIVDEAALLGALDSGQVSSYGTDVFETEPPDSSDPLLAHPKVLATLHTAAMTQESKRAMALQAAENVIAGLEGTLDAAVTFNRGDLGP
jgi:D-3-phosphoglycerate dehydrogenase